MNGEGGTYRSSAPERLPDVIFIIFFKKTPVNDVDDIPAVFCPMYIHQRANSLLNLRGQQFIRLRSMPQGEHIRYGIRMFFPHFP